MSSAPGLKFLAASPAHLIACGLGSGLSPFAPGTAGTLAAWLLFPLLRANFSDAGLLIFLAASFALGIFAAARTGRDLGVADHGAIVWDEMVPFWLVLLMTPDEITWQIGAFLLFRGFDILKPPPAGWIDREIKNGFGVMADDVVAAFYTLVVLALTRVLLG